MSAAFTPGPWRACKNGDCSCGHVWSIPADFHLATAHETWGDEPDFPDGTMPRAEMQANARLIAAAPELYRVLELVRYAETGAEDWSAVDDVLAKARGEQVPE